MVNQNEGEWALPRRKPITEEILDQAILNEEKASFHEHHARVAWFDIHHDAVLIILADGRAFGAHRSLIPSLQEATQQQLNGLSATQDGAFLTVAELDLHINVDALVTRLMEHSPITIRQTAARLAGRTTSVAKAKASAKNGQLGGRPRKQTKALQAI